MIYSIIYQLYHLSVEVFPLSHGGSHDSPSKSWQQDEKNDVLSSPISISGVMDEIDNMM